MALTAKSIDSYLKRKGSPLAGLGSVFMAQGPRVAGLLVAIAGAESSFGKVNSGAHNAWGWGPGRDFPSWQAAIQAIGQGLKSGYLSEGRTSIPQIGAKWAPQGAANDPTNLNSNWVKNVRQFYRELGGAPGGPGSAPNALGGANTSSGMPQPSGGLQDAAFQNLSDIASGHYDPLKALSSLTSVSPSGPAGTGPSPAPLAGGGATKGGITYSGQKLTHETSGLGGYPAVDIFAKAGTPFLAPESGRVIRYQSTGGGTSGQVYGYGLYFKGDSGRTYFVTHLGPNRAPVGARVRKGGRLGAVSRWDSGSSHAHVGVHG